MLLLLHRFLNGTELYEDRNYRILSKPSGVYELRINNIDYIHEGMIRFRVRNLYEEIERTWNLHIDGKSLFY